MSLLLPTKPLVLLHVVLVVVVLLAAAALLLLLLLLPSGAVRSSAGARRGTGRVRSLASSLMALGTDGVRRTWPTLARRCGTDG